MMQPSKAKIYENLIGGHWVKSSSGKTFPSINPADTSDVIGLFQEATLEETRQAIEAAKESQPAWAETSPARRAEILYKAAQLIEEKSAELAETLTREEGKTLAESNAEVKRAAANFRFYAGQAYLISGETLPSDEPSTSLYTLRLPVGVVSAITPWNFPLTIPARKIAPALAAGNSIVFKPASLTPLMGIKLGEILSEAGLPGGVINVVTGPACVVGEEMVSNTSINAITFTGSYNVGDRIQHRALTTCRTQLEMGGKNPIIVLEDADLDLAVSCTIQGAFGLSGQACTGTSRAIVSKEVIDLYKEKLIQSTKQITIGDGLTKGVKMGPVADAQQEKTILEYIEIGKREGAELIHGGRKLEGNSYARGFFIEPAIFSQVKPQMRIAQEEIFGPVLAIIEAEDFDEAIMIANQVEYGLSASICTRDLGRAERFTRLIEAGMVKINQPTTGVALNAPFGGTKKSSSETYREQGRIALDFFTRVKTVSLKY
ncbi:MAG TPA: aldehyde dehydrogenase family protein [Pyrinomonadaceae bacterium]|nr:aldehyde dehydrogenase family protein [Pyrinomonadaceae bacterium]